MNTNSIPTVIKNYGKIEVGIGATFSEIPEQARDYSIKNGFNFNLLVIGRRGLGTATLVNSLYCPNLVDKKRSNSITTSSAEINENGVTLNISVTTYHGKNFTKIVDHIDNLNKEYFELEQGIKMPFVDRRIHCCLYLVPTDRIEEDEILGVKELSNKVNLIPIITKADMFTSEELAEQREKIYETFLEREIKFYDYGETDLAQFPIATIASEQSFIENGITVRGRKYPWGYVDIENTKYSDFIKLQKILIGERFIDLVTKTDLIFYEFVRRIFVSNETSASIKTRFFSILKNLEDAIDQKYKAKLSMLTNTDISHISHMTEQICLESQETLPSSLIN